MPVRANGFTLLELLVVLALIGLMMGVVVPMVGDVMDLRIKQGARRLAATVQYLYGKATTQRLTIRLVYNLDKQTYWAESSRDRFLLVKEESPEKRGVWDEKKKQEAKEKKESDEAGEGEEAAPEGPSFTAEEGLLLSPTALPDDVLFKDVYAVHQREPVVQGEAYTYFFPNGQVEWSIVNLKDEGDRVNYGLEIMPVTGRVRIEKHYIDYREAERAQDEGQ